MTQTRAFVAGFAILVMLVVVVVNAQDDSYCYRNSIIGSFDNHNLQPSSWVCYQSALDSGLVATTNMLDMMLLEYNDTYANLQPVHTIQSYYIYLLIHDYQGSAYDEWIIEMARSLYARTSVEHPRIVPGRAAELGGVQVLALDWSRAATKMTSSNGGKGPRYQYAQAVLNAREASRLLGNLLNDLITDYNKNPNAPFANLHCIGHGVGAHICGIASKVFKAGRPFWKPFNRITGLDPARALFERSDDDIEQPQEKRLDSRDAFFVDVIHTTNTYGYKGKVGLIDHFVNAEKPSLVIGQQQPGCTTEFCSHLRAVDIFQSTIDRDYGYSGYYGNCTFAACSGTYSASSSCRLGFESNSHDCQYHPGATYCGFIQHSYAPYC